MIFQIRYLDLQDNLRYAHDVDCQTREIAFELMDRLFHDLPLELWRDDTLVRRYALEPVAEAELDINFID